MKVNKLLIGVAVIATLTACEKEETYTRNYSYPINSNEPLENLAGSNVLVEKGMSDEDVMRKIRTFSGMSEKEKPVIFLTPNYYGGEEVENPNPEYMLFPHSINSMSDVWGWDYYYEYVNLGEQAFCDKYLNGELTLGMKLD